MAIAIKAWLPNEGTINQKTAVPTTGKTAPETGDYAGVLSAATIDAVRSDQKVRRVEIEQVETSAPTVESPPQTDQDPPETVDGPTTGAAATSLLEQPVLRGGLPRLGPGNHGRKHLGKRREIEMRAKVRDDEDHSEIIIEVDGVARQIWNYCDETQRRNCMRLARSWRDGFDVALALSA